MLAIKMTEALSLMKLPEKTSTLQVKFCLIYPVITRLMHDFKVVLWSTFKALTLELLKVMVTNTSLKEVSWLSQKLL
jgi:hypothetical protein